MARRRERSEDLEDLLYDALREGLEHAVVSAQRNDRDAQTFVNAYKEFYLNGKKPSKELGVQAGKYVNEVLSIDATCLHHAGYRWSTGLTYIFGAVAGAFALTRNWKYALGTAACAAVSYVARFLTKKWSRRDAEDVQSAIAFKPDLFEGFLQESKEYMGEELRQYGALHEEQVLGNARPAQKPRRYRRSKV